MTNPAYEATNSDVEKLIADMKEAALRATPGPWRRTSTQFNGITHGPFSFTKEDVLGHFAEKCNAEFVSVCDPKNVLALIAALEQARLRGDEWKEKCSEAVEHGANRIAELQAAPNGMMQMSNELAEMKRKCAELETAGFKPVKLPELVAGDYGHKYLLNAREVVEAIQAAGGTVEGSE